MSIWVWSSRKGGVGKSTNIYNVALELIRRKYKVFLFDADRQGTVFDWIEVRRKNNHKPEIESHNSDSERKFGQIAQSLMQLDKKYDFVLVDTAGHDSEEMTQAMAVADLFIMPFRPSQADLNTVLFMQEKIKNIRDKFNPNLMECAYLSMTKPNTSRKTKEAQIIFKKGFSNLNFLQKVKIDERVSFEDTLCDGLGVIEWKDPTAKAQIQILVNELLKHENKHKEENHA